MIAPTPLGNGILLVLLSLPPPTLLFQFLQPRLPFFANKVARPRVMQPHTRLQSQYNLVLTGPDQLPLLRVRAGLGVRILDRDGCSLCDSQRIVRCNGEGVRVGGWRGEDGGVRVLFVEDFAGGLFGEGGDEGVDARIGGLIEAWVARCCACLKTRCQCESCMNK